MRTTYARQCEHCKQGMNEGYVIAGGVYYYCGIECLHKEVSEAEWEELYGDGDSDSYYTEWEEGDHQYEEVNGQLVEIEQ